MINSQFISGGGVAVGDINNDGLQDIYFSGSMESGKLYLNMGDFKFRDITGPSGVNPGVGIKTGVCMVDVNGDGYLDIYISVGGSGSAQNILLLNSSADPGNFSITHISGDTGDSRNVRVLDVNNDGLEDFIIGGSYGHSASAFFQQTSGNFVEKQISNSSLVLKLF